MKTALIEELSKLFSDWSGSRAINIESMAVSGSYRQYFRIMGDGQTAVGVINDDIKENLAFLGFTRHFINKNLAVPNILGIGKSGKTYLLQDLGDTTLFVVLNRNENTEKCFNDYITGIYKSVLQELPKFQISAGKDLDYSVCYPRDSFDRQSMMWDLNYFKYYFLKLAQINFDEQKLEDDFHALCDYLLEAENHFFLYRDFQSRNIMIFNEKPWFIDYQGGRKGALQYDLASLLYDAKAGIPEEVRITLRDYYLDNLEHYINVDRKKFIEYYYGFVLIRILQAMGAYGFRGFYEKKTHFLQSIPYALKNLEFILNNYKFPIQLTTLLPLLSNLTQSEKLKEISVVKEKLTIQINSFSYRNCIPEDSSGNGGGFVFDCRALPNPGRFEKYKYQTGKESEVIQLLEKHEEVIDFINNVKRLVEPSIENYISRGFSNLMISFGCTGGQHRSVYCAEKLFAHLNKKYQVNVVLKHYQIENLFITGKKGNNSV